MTAIIKYTLIIFSLLLTALSSNSLMAQLTVTCSDFTISGSSSFVYNNGISGTPFFMPACIATNAPVGQLMPWTGNLGTTGTLKHTYSTPQTSVTIPYGIVNGHDTGTVSINGGGTLTVTATNSCTYVSGNRVGYAGPSGYGAIEVTISSTTPFTEVTLTNTGGESGFVAAGCMTAPAPTANLGNDTTLCIGETLTFNVLQPTATYLWNTGFTGEQITISTAGTYWVEVTIGTDVAKDTIVVAYQPCSSEFTLNCADFTIIGTDSFPYSRGISATCIASPEPTAGEIMPWTGNTGTTGTIEHNYSSPQTSVIIPYTIVNGHDTGTISIDGGGVLTVTSNNSCTFVNGPVIGYAGPTGFGAIEITISSTIPFTKVTLTNTGGESGFVAGGCSAPPIPNPFDLGNNLTLCNDDEIELDAAQPSASYLWQDSSTAETFNVKESGTYWVQVTVGLTTLSDTIQVDFKDCSTIIKMPNVFTPNNDGKNNLFIPIIMKNITTADIEIYNRWGVKVYKNSDITLGWDGKHNNKESAEGTYFWIVNYSSSEQTNSILKGTFTLLR